MNINVVVFPGSNCDHDIIHLFEQVLGQQVQEVWHRDTELKSPDLLVLPGGFSYGDYLRTGALAKLSPIIKAVKKFADDGGPVLGICNGFQILCETGLLPGVLLQNSSMKFLSRFLHYRVEREDTLFSRAYAKGEVITSPVAHFEGNFYCSDEELKKLEEGNQVVFRYCGADGSVDAESAEWNPNGSREAIAGIVNERGNVLGMMPHPERAAESIVGRHGAESGLGLFRSVVEQLGTN